MVTWDLVTACEKVLKYFVDGRNNAPRCVVCNSVLYDYEPEIFSYLYLLEVKYRKIHGGMFEDIIRYVYVHYPFKEDKSLHRHHVNYAKNIQVPTCQSCHSKIHHSDDSKYAKWKPVDKKPKNFKGFETNMYKPLT